MKTLSTEEIETFLEGHRSWTPIDGKIVRDWIFANFTEAMVFVNLVAGIAEAADHHPDFDIRYNKVRLTLISHDAGCLTRRDARMAAELDRVFPPKN
ncbi:4a-hydroxytetrahydrobiopterin dehydratase [Granulicella sibirica]|uniref:Putative pterin-4-alpha-carbinolamine dehydratase n=1 Tax=Granulicella sibirica TaxID=2479048 RepID=A0A4Q0T2Z2_9BACT|nr:4a-hydroxytetrahydrobiopterin dehydratase [Granulicella sibirica]RXH55901.1 Pterin-4-alpha-carbinolamine dehydratase [Granulicella sibirica]